MRTLVEALNAEAPAAPSPEAGALWCPYCKRNYTDRPQRRRCACGRAVVHVPAIPVAKPFSEMDDEEMAESCRRGMARMAHEASEIRLPTTVGKATQGGFAFMRTEFR